MPQTHARMRDAFLDAVLARMRKDDAVFFLSLDFGSPVLDIVVRDFPDRFVNVGIAEQNLINVATGMALEGHSVVAYAIAPFLTMRCYEQVRVNLSLLSEVRRVNVTLAGVGAGLSYDVSGPSHQALEDISIMRTLPNLEVLSPADSVSAGVMAEYCLTHTGCKYVRLDGKPLPTLYDDATPFPDIGRGFQELRKGRHVCLLSTGYMTHKALAAARCLQEQDGVDAGVIDMFALSRFDRRELAAALAGYRTLVTLEEAFAGRGGLDACVMNFLREEGLDVELVSMGLPHRYSFQVGPRDALLEAFDLGPESILRRLREVLSRRAT